MQSEGIDLLFFQDEEGDRQKEGEEEDAHLNSVGEEDAVAFTLRSGQAINVRELRSQGLSFQIWPAAHALCWYLDHTFAPTGMLKTHLSHLPTSENSTFQPNMRVLELGAGTGMVGILCAVLGAHCTITDLPHVTSNLEYNAILNQDAVQSSGLGGSVVVKSLRWGERADVEAVGHSFDLIVASDVVYYDHLFEPLLSTLEWLLYSPPCHMAATLEDRAVPSTTTAAKTTTTTNGVAISCMPTVKPLVGALHTIEESSVTLPSIGENATILEEILLPVRDANATSISGMYLAGETTARMPCAGYTTSVPTPCSIASIATRSKQWTREDTAPVVLLAHLRRWKKDSHFFKKASKLFHTTVVHKHAHDANSRTGVTIYSFSRKKK